jgi:predicted nucleic acid-binding Zn ribbon protein
MTDPLKGLPSRRRIRLAMILILAVLTLVILGFGLRAIG